jgi:hypothetical protein
MYNNSWIFFDYSAKIHIFVPLSGIPQKLVFCFLTIEYATFEHIMHLNCYIKYYANYENKKIIRCDCGFNGRCF